MPLLYMAEKQHAKYVVVQSMDPLLTSIVVSTSLPLKRTTEGFSKVSEPKLSETREAQA